MAIEVWIQEPAKGSNNYLVGIGSRSKTKSGETAATQFALNLCYLLDLSEFTVRTPDGKRKTMRWKG